MRRSRPLRGKDRRTNGSGTWRARSFRAQQRFLQHRRLRVLRAVRTILADGAARGELRALDVALAAELFMGLVRAALYRRRPADTPDHLVATLLGIFFDGVAA